MSNVPESFEPLEDFVCPPEFWPSYGYEGAADYVGIYWEPGGDEAAYHDGRHVMAGADWPTYQYLLSVNIRLEAITVEQSHLLGGSESVATHFLVLEREGEGVWIAPRKDAEGFLIDQWQGKTPSPFQQMFDEAEDMDAFLERLQEAIDDMGEVDEADLAAAMQKQEEAYAEFLAGLRREIGAAIMGGSTSW